MHSQHSHLQDLLHANMSSQAVPKAGVLQRNGEGYFKKPQFFPTLEILREKTGDASPGS